MCEETLSAFIIELSEIFSSKMVFLKISSDQVY